MNRMLLSLLGHVAVPPAVFLLLFGNWSETHLFHLIGGPVTNGLLAVGFGTWLVRYNNQTSLVAHYYGYEDDSVGLYLVNTGKTTIAVYNIRVDGELAENLQHDISLAAGEIHRCTLVQEGGVWRVREKKPGLYATSVREVRIGIESAVHEFFEATRHP